MLNVPSLYYWTSPEEDRALGVTSKMDCDKMSAADLVNHRVKDRRTVEVRPYHPPNAC